MKTIFKRVTYLSILCVFAFYGNLSLAQQTITVELIKESMSKGTQPGFSVVIPQSNLDKVKKAWIKKIQSDTKSKVLELDYEIQIMGANTPKISPNPVNIYSILITKDSSVNLIAFFEVDSAFFNPDDYPDKLIGEKIASGIKGYLREFALDQYRDAVEGELAVEENKLDELNSRIEALEKDIEKQQKTIKEKEQDISSADDEIKSLKISKEQSVTAIGAQKIKVSGSVGENKKIEEDVLKNMEKEKKKTDNEITKLEKDIVGFNSDIKDCEKTITDNNEEINLLNENIFDQEEVVRKVETKLAGIK